MFSLAVVCAFLAVACAAPAPGIIAPLATPLISPALPATLLPRVAVAPAQTTIVRQPIVVDHPEPILRSVPVPIRAVSYAAPTVISAAPLATPLVASPWAASPLVASPWAGSSLLASPLASAPLLLK